MYVVVLLFIAASAAHPTPQHQIVRCPNMPCVERLLEDGAHSPMLARIRVWRQEDFSMIDPGKQFIWPAMIDHHYL